MKYFMESHFNESNKDYTNERKEIINWYRDIEFNYKFSRHVRGNKYGRTEEIYECENCEGCPHKEKCCPKASGNRRIQMNRELTAIHKEVLGNLNSIIGCHIP